MNQYETEGNLEERVKQLEEELEDLKADVAPLLERERKLRDIKRAERMLDQGLLSAEEINQLDELKRSVGWPF